MSPVAYTGLWRMRLMVARAIVLLVSAQVLVRRVRWSRWRASLGSDAISPGTQPHAPATRAHIAALVHSVERATHRLPWHVKCLPRAMALQWLLHWQGIGSQIVIAAHRHDRSGPDGYHAWVESDGAMLIGHCDPGDYHPVLRLSWPDRP